MDDDVKFGKLHFQKRCENHPTSTERHRVMEVLRKPKLKCDFDRDEGDEDGRLYFFSSPIIVRTTKTSLYIQKQHPNDYFSKYLVLYL